MEPEIKKATINEAANNVIIALDFPGQEEAQEFLDNLHEVCLQEQEAGPDNTFMPYVKVGMELFYSAGPDIIRKIKARGYKIFLDLKLHDIPNTVGRSMEVLGKLGVDMVNCHAAGGRKMMEAAREGLERGWEKTCLERGWEDAYMKRGFEKKGIECATARSEAAKGIAAKRPLLIAVTQLTSTDEQMLHEELLIDKLTVEDAVIKYAKNVRAAGLDGVVCSPLEAERIHREIGDDFLTVTPGIRFAKATSVDSTKAAAATDDQHRITTPEDAGRIGSDYIVVGRPITRAADPVKAYQKCRDDFARGREVATAVEKD